MVIFISFIFGFLAALAALGIELIVSVFFLSSESSSSFLFPSLFLLFILALIEEGTKILFYFKSLRFIQNDFFSLTYGLFFGLGFATLEYLALSNIDTPREGPAIGIALVHIITSLLMVFLLKRNTSPFFIVCVLLLLVIIHFGYNSLL